MTNNLKVGDKVTYQMTKRERGNAVVDRVSTAKANHLYIKTEREGVLLVPITELRA